MKDTLRERTAAQKGRTALDGGLDENDTFTASLMSTRLRIALWRWAVLYSFNSTAASAAEEEAYNPHPSPEQLDDNDLTISLCCDNNSLQLGKRDLLESIKEPEADEGFPGCRYGNPIDHYTAYASLLTECGQPGNLFVPIDWTGPFSD